MRQPQVSLGSVMGEERKALIGKIGEPLCTWFERSHRKLYWRSHPLPYYVWISEIMLQQTRVEAVKEYFARFIRELPDVEALAGADEEHLMKLWEGLGYYNRARNLKKAAVVIMERYGGKVPSDYEELKKLPGIGEYTAGAIASIAFGKQEPAVDGNVLRVIMRLTDDPADILKETVKRELRRDLKEAMPEKPGIFNQALMELGALVCVPNGLPKCSFCPLKVFCRAEDKGIENQLSYAQSLPYKAPKKERKIEERTVLLIERNGEFAVKKRNKRGLLAGMWEFPSLSGCFKEEEVRLLLLEAGMEFEAVKPLGCAKHIFSHIEWHMQGYRILLKDLPYIKEEQDQRQVMPVLSDLLDGCRWETKEGLQENYPLPSAFEAYKQELGIG